MLRRDCAALPGKTSRKGHFVIIVGIDTGLYTGMAYWDTKIMAKPNAIEVPYAETGQQLFRWLEGTRQRPVVHVACERYTMISGGGPKTSQPEALMGMGAVEYICKAEGRPLTWYFPKDAKKLATNELLRELGWHIPTKDGHADDGQRILLKWYAEHYPRDFAELVGI